MMRIGGFEALFFSCSFFFSPFCCTIPPHTFGLLFFFLFPLFMYNLFGHWFSGNRHWRKQILQQSKGHQKVILRRINHINQILDRPCQRNSFHFEKSIRSHRPCLEPCANSYLLPLLECHRDTPVGHPRLRTLNRKEAIRYISVWASMPKDPQASTWHP